MIDDLSVAKTAAFFAVRRKLSDRAIEDLFRSIRSAHSSASRNIFKYSRESANDSRWSAICFTYERSPTFLEPATDVKETLCGYLMLVEYENHAVVFASRLGLPTSFKSKYLSPVSVNRVEGAIARQDAVFKKMRMRNMSVSQYAMRNKTLEAADLANVVGPAGSRRYAPQTYTVEHDGIDTTATPSTGRISVRSDRVGHDGMIEFAKEVIDALRVDVIDVSPFIRTFARPVSLTEALAATEPIVFAIDTSKLIDAVAGDEPAIRLVHPGENPTELTVAEFQALIHQLDQALEIDGNGKLRKAHLPDSNDQAASISLNKSRIALRSLDLPPASDVEVETTAVPLGEDSDRRSLHRYLDETDAFIVLFDDVRLAYIDGTLFRDETLLDGGAAFLRYFRTEPTLEHVVSEKGGFSAAQTTFDATSSFGVIVDHLAVNDPILLCDDLDDEWADFIGLRNDGGFTQVSFYHAKHGELSLGAGAFHVAVSQAIKNLGNMGLPPERMAAKVQRWSNLYNAPGQATQIPRTIRSNTANLGDALAQARNAPDSIRRAVIVTSSISKQAVADALIHVQNGGRPRPSFVQLYWLLQSFFSACVEVGATGTIVCRP